MTCGGRLQMAAPADTVSVEAYERLVVKYNDLAQRYKGLKQHTARREEWTAQCVEKYNGMKECVQQWQAYIDRHRNRAPALEAQSTPSTIVATKQTSPRVSSSQTTEAEQESSPPKAHDQASSDEPQVVSTRSLKRKRVASPLGPHTSVYIKQEEANSPENPINLISDDCSSPKMTRQKPVRTETSDLDAYVHHMDTPRKRRRRRGGSEEASRPVPLPVNTSSLSDGNLRDEQQIINLGLGERLNSVHDNPRVSARDFAADSVSQSGNQNALRPRSVNIPSTSNSTSTLHVANAKRKRADPRKIAIVSEDGEDHGDQTAAILIAATPRGEIKHRLNTLLEQPTPDRQPLSARRPPAATASRPRELLQSPQRRKNKDVSEHQPALPYKTPLGLGQPPTPALPEDEPLRERRWQTLSLEDFRINPKFMGTDYAFSETFRGREARRCLPGCTRPECCGNTFRKAVEMGAARTNKTDEEVLEAFLGRNHRQIMAAYSADKRKDMLVQAHAQALANLYGKHRHAYERPRTPPGFWRTDMPTTQEAEEDRARAHEIYLQKVEERWREAMRDGGRWLFRDE